DVLTDLRCPEGPALPFVRVIQLVVVEVEDLHPVRPPVVWRTCSGLIPERSPSRGQSGSCIESEHDLVRFLVAPVSEPPAPPHEAKTALRQHTKRRGVVARGAQPRSVTRPVRGDRCCSAT